MWRKQPSSYWVWFPTEYLTIYCVSNRLWPTLACSGKAAPNPRSPSQAGGWIGQCCLSAIPVLACCRDTQYWILEPILLTQRLVSLHPGLMLPPRTWSQSYRAAGHCCVRYLGLPLNCSQKGIKKGSEVNFMMQTRILEWQSPAWTHPRRQEEAGRTLVFCSNGHLANQWEESVDTEGFHT